MNVAVISDIHGFSVALRYVLASIDREPGIDRIVAAGDLCEGGPDPAGVLHLLRERGIDAVRGNTDHDLVADVRESEPAIWTREQLGADGLLVLAALPFAIRIEPPGGRALDDDLLIVHANPFDLYRKIPPDASDLELRELIDDTRAAVIAFGHIHIAYRRVWEQYQLIDVSAVGNPKDGDLRSKWGLCRWSESTGAWTTELRYVDYPLEETVAQMEESGMPRWQKAAEKLQRASYGER